MLNKIIKHIDALFSL